MDLNAIKKTIQRELKVKLLGKSKYGSKWTGANNDWYSEIHDSNQLLHEDFKNYFIKKKNDIHSVLEIGCGTGIYPIENKTMFEEINYTGIDISKDAIAYCKKNSNFNFICDDFIKMRLENKFDLVYSHAVIDHVYDIDAFMTKILDTCTKFAYINSYRGYFPQLDAHKSTWRDDVACYFNDISIKQIKKILIKNGLEEKNFIIRPQENGTGVIQTVIEITKPPQR